MIEVNWNVVNCPDCSGRFLLEGVKDEEEGIEEITFPLFHFKDPAILLMAGNWLIAVYNAIVSGQIDNGIPAPFIRAFDETESGS